MDVKERVRCAVVAACNGQVEKKLRELAEECTEDFDPDDAHLPPFYINLCGGPNHFSVRITPIIEPETRMEREAVTNPAFNPTKAFVALLDTPTGQLITHLPFE